MLADMLYTTIFMHVSLVAMDDLDSLTGASIIAKWIHTDRELTY